MIEPDCVCIQPLKHSPYINLTQNFYGYSPGWREPDRLLSETLQKLLIVL